MGKVVQNQFIKFHEAIRLDVEDNREVVAKRDMLIEEIRAYIKKMCEEKKIKLIKFEPFNQGSYSMGTGVKPLNDEDDYDIDCGLLFEVSIEDYTPLEVKQWVFDALDKKQFRTVEWKNACIRVQYTEQGLPKFHVDFAVYSNANWDGKIYLAKGTPGSSSEDKKWEQSEPKKLRDLINNRFQNLIECRQFKRTIRYMKRWKDNQFTSVNGKPTGIAFTALAYNGFQPSVRDWFTNAEDINDLRAIKNFVEYILNQFGYDGRIRVQLPVLPGNDLFAKMKSDNQHQTLKNKLQSLYDSLSEADGETDPHEACKIIRKQFGDDFPVPPKEETGQSRKKAIAGTSESA